MKVDWFHISHWGRCVALRFVLVLPLSPSIWSLYVTGPFCLSRPWTTHGGDPVECLFLSAMSPPFWLIVGPIAHDEVEPPSAVPKVLLTAFVFAALATVLSTVFRSLRPRK